MASGRGIDASQPCEGGSAPRLRAAVLANWQQGENQRRQPDGGSLRALPNFSERDHYCSSRYYYSRWDGTSSYYNLYLWLSAHCGNSLTSGKSIRVCTACVSHSGSLLDPVFPFSSLLVSYIMFCILFPTSMSAQHETATKSPRAEVKLSPCTQLPEAGS